jgi:hypothetical protein
MKIDSVTVGGYSRSRCSGRCYLVISSNSGPVSGLENRPHRLAARVG